MKRGAEGERARLNGDEASKKELQEHGDWRANIICDDRADVTKVDYAYLVISLKYVAGIMKRGAEGVAVEIVCRGRHITISSTENVDCSCFDLRIMYAV